jgi:hypothetical protein
MGFTTMPNILNAAVLSLYSYKTPSPISKWVWLREKDPLVLFVEFHGLFFLILKFFSLFDHQ